MKSFIDKKEEDIKEEKKAPNLIKSFSSKQKEEKKYFARKTKFDFNESEDNSLLKGTNIGAPIVPGSVNDSFPTHNEKYGLGGYRSVEDVEERNSIPFQRRKEGMIVRTNVDNKEWILSKDLETWTLRTVGINSVESLEEHLNFKVNSYNPNIYGITNIDGDLHLSGHFSTGIILQEGVSTAKVCIKTKILDFTKIKNTNIFKVPKDHMFMIDSIEVITLYIETPENPPSVRFGINGFNDFLLESKEMNINGIGARHIIDDPYQGLPQEVQVTMGVTKKSTAKYHKGVGLIKGYLIKIID